MYLGTNEGALLFPRKGQNWGHSTLSWHIRKAVGTEELTPKDVDPECASSTTGIQSSSENPRRNLNELIEDWWEEIGTMNQWKANLIALCNCSQNLHELSKNKHSCTGATVPLLRKHRLLFFLNLYEYGFTPEPHK